MWGGSGRLLEEVKVALGLEEHIGVGQVVKGGWGQSYSHHSRGDSMDKGTQGDG